MGEVSFTQSAAVSPRFGILGPLRVTDTSDRPVPLGGPRARELLALLLLNPNRPLSSERLVTAMWGESPSRGAATTLRTHIAAVRRVLQSAGAGGALSTRDGGYLLSLHPADLDAEVFTGLVHRGQEAHGLGDPEHAAALLGEALALWRGSVLSDLGLPPFADSTVARLDELRVVAEETAMTAALDLGQHREVVGRLQGLVAAHPFHERFCWQLMVALYRSGRQVDALSVYAQTKQLLADELGLDPGSELQDIETAVLRHDPGLLLSGGATPVQVRSSIPPTVRLARPPEPLDAVFAELRRSTMVGRDGWLATMTESWGEARQGGRGLVAVSGPAGVGKSRLAAELAHLAAQDGAIVLIGRCDPAVPYAALASALAGSATARQLAACAPPGVRSRLHPLLPLDADTPAERERVDDPALQQALVRAVEWLVDALAAEAPLLLVIEDAEQLTVEESGLLAGLARRLAERTLITVCFRDPPGSRHPPLADLLGRPGVYELTLMVPLKPLDREDLGALIASLHPRVAEVPPTLVDALLQRTSGNPLFAREVLRDLDAADLRSGQLGHRLPAGLLGVLRHRLGLLHSDTRAAVSAAAVLGREIDLTRLVHLLDEHEEWVVSALDQALTSGFLIEAGQSWASEYAFPHELMWEAVYGEIPVPRRQRLHQRAVDAVLGNHPTEADVIVAAGHALHAGPAADPAEASALVDHAAALATASFGFDVAVRLAEARLPLLRHYAHAAEQATADAEVARLRIRAGRGYGRAAELLERALGTYLSLGDTVAAGSVHSRLGGVLAVPHPGMDVVRALEHFTAAERMLPPSTDLFSLHRGRLSAAMLALDTTTMASAADRCATIADSAGRPELAVIAEWGRGWLALDLGHPDAALTHLEEAWSVAQSLGDPLVGWPPTNAASLMCTVYLLDPTQGRSWCRRGLAQPRVDRLAHQHDALADQLVLALATTGEIEAARRAAARLPKQAVGRRLVRFLLGDWETAAAQWQAALSHDLAAGDRHDAVLNARWFAEALLSLGEERQATEVLHQALEIAISAPQVPSELWIRARLAGLATTTPAEAAAHLSRCEVVLATGGDWRGLVGEVALARAMMAVHGSDWEAGALAAQEAVAVFGRYRLPWRHAAALRAWARADEAAGRPGDARARHDEAVAVLSRIGAGERWRTNDLIRTTTGLTVSTRPQRASTTLEP